MVIKALVESDYYSTNSGNETVLFPESSKKILIPILNFGILMGGRYCFNRIKELENDLGIEFGIGGDMKSSFFLSPKNLKIEIK